MTSSDLKGETVMCNLIANEMSVETRSGLLGVISKKKIRSDQHHNPDLGNGFIHIIGSPFTIHCPVTIMCRLKTNGKCNQMKIYTYHRV